MNTAFMTRGSEVAFSRGMLLVTSAGNSGNSSNPYIAVPADGISVLAIGAVNSLSFLTSFSSRGPSLMEELNPISWLKDKQVVSDPAGNIVTANGTSFSSPIMAGMVCLWQAFPQKKQIRN
jgi:subtilisin family serine protease